MTNLEQIACADCGKALPPRPPGQRGRRRRYCDAACRQRARRRRGARDQADALSSRAAAARVLAVEGAAMRRRSAEAIVAQMDGQPPGPPEERIAQALLELAQISHELRTAAVEVAPQLAGPAAALAGDVDRALNTRFAGVMR